MTLEKIDDPAEGPASRFKKRDPLLFSVLVTVFTVFSWLFFLVEKPLEAQVIEDVKIIHEFPLTKNRLELLEKNVDVLKDNLKDMRQELHEQHSDIRVLMLKLDEHNGR